MSNILIKALALNMISIMIPLKFLMKLLAAVLRTLAEACEYTATAANKQAVSALDVVDYINYETKQKQSNEDQDSEFCPLVSGQSYSSVDSKEFPF